jgi:predicted CXXCH cytochrome family protein
MKRLRLTCCVAALGVLTVMAAAQARAEMVSHHTVTVEANGLAYACISCHDGKAAKHVSFCTVKCDYSSSHAVLKKYPPPGKAASYAPVAALQAKGIKLEDGKVTCISCHDLRKTGRYHLVMDNKQSKLCFVCHVDI